MTKIIRNARKRIARKERGQVIVVVAIAAVAIIAIIGLVLDVGIIFIGNARLRRAVDSAALAAALQYRENYTTQKLTDAANEFLALNMNGYSISDLNSVVSDCDNSPLDTTLCSTTFQRKLVRVHATAQVQLAFLPVIGINTANISAEAMSETASLDVVMVIDRSESMSLGLDYSNQLDITNPLRDPSYCNITPDAPYGTHTGSCEPMNHVIDAAKKFTDILFLPYDHFSVVTFDREAQLNLGLDANCPTNGDPCDATHIRSDVIYPTLAGLTVFEGEKVGSPASEDKAIYGTYPSASPARCYDDRAVGDMNTCPRCVDTPDWGLPSITSSNYRGLIGRKIDVCSTSYTGDPSTYTTTNIGAGLLFAGNQLSADQRQDSLWVVILLTDGVPNAGHDSTATTYYCPSNTWGGIAYDGSSNPTWPRCNDNNAATRHTGGSANSSYDASDYAYDMADFVGKAYPTGQDALIYTIGLGPEVDKYVQPTYIDPNNNDPINYPYSTGEGIGRIFLNYAASDNVGRGQAFYAASATELSEIFRLIGTNIATRLSQ